MTVAVTCPDRATLERLLEQGADPDEVERLAGHLETCARCGEMVEDLLAADPTAASLRGASSGAQESSDELLLNHLVMMRLFAPEAPPHAPAAGAEATDGGASSSEATQDGNPPMAPAQQPDEIGRLGGYRILKELGRGGMGAVYKAEDVKLKRLVALKAMLPNLAADATARQRFLREAQAMAAVHHDHIVVIHAVDEDNGVPFLAMEFLQGMPMDQWLKGGRKPSIAQVLRLGREIAEGLAAAHERGLIHRDIKPGNIWLDSSHQGRVKILDFGLARSRQEDVHLTRTGVIVGTPAYMAPEQARCEKVDARSDLFSLGCLLYKLCTGAMPFAGDNTMSLLTSLALDHPKPVREINADVPAELSDLVMKLLEKDPAKRPQSALEVIQALQAVGRTASLGASSPTMSAVIPPPLPAPAATPAPPQGKAAPGRGKRRPWIVAAVATGFLATAIAATVVVLIRDKDGNPIAEVKVPPGGKVEVVDDGKKGDAAIALKPPPDDAWLKQVAALPAEKQVTAVVAKLKELNPGFDGKVTPNIENGVVTGLGFVSDNVTDISPVRALQELKLLWCCGSVVGSGKGQLSDLTPLKDMKIKDLRCNDTQVSDLSPLNGLPLTDLWCGDSPASDLSPLKGMPLTFLHCDHMPVSDLSPLKGMPLKELKCDFKPERDAEILRSLKTLEKINGKPAAEFWKDAGVAAKPPVDDAWVKLVAALPADKQVDAVAAKLKELNPGFDGKLAPNIEDGVVTGLWQILADDVTDISPVRALHELKVFQCDSKGDSRNSPLSDLKPLKGLKLSLLSFSHTQVSDLSPLKDMPLSRLSCTFTPVSDLSPLKGMPLTDLWCGYSRVSDLSPLKGMPLTNLNCGGTPVSDLSPLKGMNMTGLACDFTQVSDLSPLKGMPLTMLNCCATRVSNLSPLKGMPLMHLACFNTQVSDLSPLKEMPLKELSCDFEAKRDAEILRSIKTLETINDKPAAEFWKDVDEKKPDPKP